MGTDSGPAAGGGSRCTAFAVGRRRPLRRLEAEDGEPPRQCFEFVGRSVAHHPGSFREGHPDGDLGGEFPQHRPRLGGGEFDDPDSS